VQEPVTSHVAGGFRDRQMQLRATCKTWDYIQDEVFVPPLPQFLPELRQGITTAIVHITRETAQSEERLILSSRHLPCDSRHACRVSVSCVQNSESFSVDWC
jgi:hypothetical protein